MPTQPVALRQHVARDTVIFSGEKLDMSKRLLTFSLAKPRLNTESLFKTYELFIYGEIHYVTLLIIFVKISFLRS